MVACSGERAGDSARVYFIKDTGHAEKILIEKTKHAFPRRAVFQGSFVIFIYSDFAEAFSINSGKKIASRESKDHALHQQTIRVVDGEISISLVAPNDPAGHFYSKFQDSRTLTEFIAPTRIGISNSGTLVLIAANQYYLYSSDNFTWDKLGNRGRLKVVRFVDFTPSSEHRFGNEGPILTAFLDSVKFTFDPRGVMHLSTENESWTIHTHVGKGSIWKSRDPGEIPSATKADFLAFLEKVKHNINPGKKS